MKRPAAALAALLSLACLAADPDGGEPLILSITPYAGYQGAQDLAVELATLMRSKVDVAVEVGSIANEAEYNAAIRAGRYDILLAEAHVAGWLRQHRGYRIAARLAGNIRYTLARDPGSDTLIRYRRLAGRMVCGQAATGLSTRLIRADFVQSAFPPRIRSYEDWRDVLDQMGGPTCPLGVLPYSLYRDNLSLKLHVIHLTRSLPNLALLLGPRISDEAAGKIHRLFLSGGGQPEIVALAGRFASKGFDTARDDDYLALAELWRYGN